MAQLTKEIKKQIDEIYKEARMRKPKASMACLKRVRKRGYDYGK